MITIKVIEKSGVSRSVVILNRLRIAAKRETKEAILAIGFKWVSIYIYICACMCVCVCARVRVHAQAHAHGHINTF